MKKLCLFLTCILGVVALCNFGRINSARAFPTFAKAFAQKYVGDEKTDAEKSLAAEMKRIKKCNVCHDPRKDENGKASKKNRNPYGKALHKFLGKEDKKDLEKALKMLDKVEDQKADGSDKSFGALIKSGKLPFEYK